MTRRFKASGAGYSPLAVFERSNEWVSVLSSRGSVRIPWASRQELLDRLSIVFGTEAIIDAFEAVGTSRPVTLKADDKSLLLEVLEHWLREVSAKGLPEGIFELRNELIDDAYHRSARSSRGPG